MASSQRRMLPSLPFELIEEILYRTPAESLIRFKLTCKKWYALITDKNFIYAHLDHSPERIIRMENDEKVRNRLTLIDPVTGSVSVSPISDELAPYRISFMIHCNGLMLCKCDMFFNSERGVIYSILAVWNPALRKVKMLESPDEWYGIGYAKTCRDNYKILSFFDYYSVVCHGKRDRMCKIYEFKSDSWRSIDADFDGKVGNDSEGVSVNGDMYWIGEKNNEGVILQFDFSMETFKHVCFCPLDWFKRLGCFNGDRLSLFQHYEKSGEIHVSVTNKLSDKVVSFTRYFNVTPPHLPELQSQDIMARPGYSIGRHRNNIAWCKEETDPVENKYYTYITLYEIDQCGIGKQTETGRYEESALYVGLSCPYVFIPSLIPVPE